MTICGDRAGDRLSYALALFLCIYEGLGLRSAATDNNSWNLWFHSRNLVYLRFLDLVSNHLEIPTEPNRFLHLCPMPYTYGLFQYSVPPTSNPLWLAINTLSNERLLHWRTAAPTATKGPTSKAAEAGGPGRGDMLYCNLIYRNLVWCAETLSHRCGDRPWRVSLRSRRASWICRKYLGSETQFKS